jgi:hypothetical protein
MMRELLAAGSEPFAEQGVAGGNAKEGEARGEEGDVEHGASDPVRPIGFGMSRPIAPRPKHGRKAH